MKICFPVQHDNGIESTVFGHFGSAPKFIVVDSETNEVSTINNRDQHHGHGACNPLKALDGHKVDAVVVVGIGAGALTRLQQSGIAVYQAKSESIVENIVLFATNHLPQFSLQGCCGGHLSDEGCTHNGTSHF